MFVKITITTINPKTLTASEKIFYKKGRNLGDLCEIVKKYHTFYGKNNVKAKIIH